MYVSQVSGIPKLAIFGEDGALLTEEGREPVLADPIEPCMSKAEAVCPSLKTVCVRQLKPCVAGVKMKPCVWPVWLLIDERLFGR